MFTQESFAVFDIAGLDERMAAIREEVQPIFKTIDERIKKDLEKELDEPLFIHIAQHRRRSVYPPENTWSAISSKKRGYKMEPHFQLGIWPDYVFMYLSIIDQPPKKEQIAQQLLQHSLLLTQLPEDTVMNTDHTKANYEFIAQANVKQALERLKKVKKGEFQVGRIIAKDSHLWQDPEQALEYMLATYRFLVPVYQLLQF
ncbi:DUF1054 domain-containing protein [Tetragenococcus koreensis]|uniref:DUF1054 domain-containing protein n=1 Tax=Tetragenococcus koreensis TaxID=290335 RepID=UPI000F4F20D9|nr:DUF1054 domain-containing protein [Tetragenococcus koreensis]AYW45820.1 DUF1054 domain-containing protein [Tetragenococcus koreensis]MCF1630941.1 DUF1054 domain-containing protein [Tetragenococcus koreensis]GEN91168.1 UPF0637 protein [Tetragenococcus koreensis]